MRERERESEFSLYKKLCISLDYKEKVYKPDKNTFSLTILKAPKIVIVLYTFLDFLNLETKSLKSKNWLIVLTNLLF